MRRALVLPVVLALLQSGPASATGSNLSWSDCSAAGWMPNRNFACNTNVGTNVLTVSFDPPDGITALNSINVILDLQSAASALGPWWRFKNPGTCRTSSLSANTFFPTAACSEPWSEPGTAGAIYLEDVGGDPSRARIAALVAVPDSLAGPVSAGTEYYALNIAINNARTVGAGSCAGCLDPVCIVLLQVQLMQPAGTPGGSPVINNPLWSHYATWQGGQINSFGCPGGSPTVNRTWGRVKSLYR